MQQDTKQHRQSWQGVKSKRIISSRTPLSDESATVLLALDFGHLTESLFLLP